MRMLTLIFALFCYSSLTGTIYLTPPPNYKPRVDVVGVFIEDGEGRMLLLHRQKNKRQENTWGIPGGKIDKNETVEQAGMREVKEETGFDIAEQCIERLETVYIVYSEKDHFTYHMLRTRLIGDPGAVKINWQEHKGFTWASPAEALRMELMPDEAPCIKLAYKISGS
jgi:8-oxo-dGTP pyrophosphatase MutT (NUDIX family)